MSRVLVVKVKEKGDRGPGCFQYKNDVNIEDWKQLALVFSDLEVHGANIKKAYEEFRDKKKEQVEWPFK